jgi:hypothetical protein
VDPFIVAFAVIIIVMLVPDCSELTLPLLVPGVLADHAHDTAATDDLALLANLFHGRSNLHVSLQTGLSDLDELSF